MDSMVFPQDLTLLDHSLEIVGCLLSIEKVSMSAESLEEFIKTPMGGDVELVVRPVSPLVYDFTGASFRTR
jgi:hypothetical protein